MPYIGRDLNRGNYLKLDDISSSFNSSTKTFNLTVGGSAFTPGSAFSILVSVGGVIQEPESAYQVNNSEITFANAPTAQDGFFCIALGVPLGIGVPGSGTVNGPQIAKPFNYDGFFYLNDASNRVGINSSIPTSALDVSGTIKASTFSGPVVGNTNNTSGISTFYDLRVSNNLTVEGTTTTLDTNLIGVDRIEVGANSNTVVGVAITQSGSADILNLYDGSTEVFSVADGGVLSITGRGDITNNPSTDVGLRITNNATQAFSTSENIEGTTNRKITPLMLRNGSSSGNTETYLGFDAGHSSKAQWNIGVKKTGSLQGDFIFNTRTGSSTSAERVRITNDGNVGIGSAIPSAKLDVNGTSKFQDDVIAQKKLSFADSPYIGSTIPPNSLRFGDNDDLILYHTGNYSGIDERGGGTGGLVLHCTNNFTVKGNASNKLRIIAKEGGAVELYHNNSKKLETNSIGIDVTGTTTDDGARHDGDVYFIGGTSGRNAVWDMSDNALEFADNAMAKFGTSDDLLLYHDGSTASILKAKAGDQLSLQADTLWFRNAANSETTAKFFGNGAVELYYDNTKRFETTNTGANFTVASNGQVNLFGLGGTNGLRISGPQSASSAFLFFNTNHQNVSGGTDQYTIQCGGANHTLMFKHGNSTGNVVFELDDSEHVRIPQDSKALKIGASQDFQFTHDGSTNIINGLYHPIEIRHQSEVHIKCVDDGAVQLYHDGSMKLDTRSSGVGIGGDLFFVDSSRIYMGSSNDFILFHDGSNSQIVNSTGNIVYRSDTHHFKDKDNGDTHAKFVHDGAVELYHDNGKKLETTSAGVQVTGALNVTTTMHIPDGSIGLQIGNSNDLKIYHDGSHTRMHHSGTGQFIIYGNDNDQVKLMKGSSEEGIILNNNGNVELYHNNVKKAETSTQGLLIPNTLGVSFGDAGCKVTGTAGSGGSAGLFFMTNSGNKWQIDGNGHFRPSANDSYDIGSSSYRARNIYGGYLSCFVNQASTYQVGEFRNQHSVYGGGVRFKSNNTYGSVEIMRYDGTYGAGLYNSTGGWHWDGNLQFHGAVSPWTDTNLNLGASNKRWQRVYSTGSNIISTSATTNDLDMIVLDGSATGFNGGNDANTEYGIQFSGCSFASGIGIQQRIGAQIIFRKEGSWNQANGGGGECKTTIAFTSSTGTFHTSPSTLAQKDRLRITSAGEIQCVGADDNKGFAVYISDTQRVAELIEHSADGELRLYTGNATPLLKTVITSYGSSYINSAGTNRFGVGTSTPLSTFDVRGPAVIADDVGSTVPSTFPGSNVQLMVYTSTTGQPITSSNCARLLIATDAKQTGAQGYHGALDFGSSDCTASGNSAEFQYRVAAIMCRGDGDTSASAGDGDLQFYTKQSNSGLTHRFDIAPDGSLTGTDQSIGNLSDQRLKTNIQDYTYDLNKFKQLKTRTFDWINPEFHREGNQRGFIAQEVETVDPYWNYQFEVSKETAKKDYDLLSDGDENYTIKDHRPGKASKLSGKDAMYVSVIQQLMSKIETLEAKVAALEGS